MASIRFVIVFGYKKNDEEMWKIIAFTMFSDTADFAEYV